MEITLYQIDAFASKLFEGKPYHWEDVPRLPDGLILDRLGGTISGVPTIPGSYKIRFTVRDSGQAKHRLKPDHFSWEFEMRVCPKSEKCLSQNLD
jgi:hypothetical protein